MKIARALFVALTALSVALLPVAATAAHVSSALSVSAHADCCPAGQDCDKESKGGCMKDAACALKCAGATAIPLASPDMVRIPASTAEFAPIPRLDLALAPNPPSPPPRA
ncbi:MAG: hypothetical protein AB7G54_11535 [Methyloceanibacter sp.]